MNGDWIKHRNAEILAAEREVTATVIAKHGSFSAPPPCKCKCTTHNKGEGGVMVKGVEKLLDAAIRWRNVDTFAAETAKLVPQVVETRLDALRLAIDNVVAEAGKSVNPKAK